MSDGQLCTKRMLPTGDAANRRSGNTLTVWRKNVHGNWQIFRDANLLAERSRKIQARGDYVY